MLLTLKNIFRILTRHLVIIVEELVAYEVRWENCDAIEEFPGAFIRSCFRLLTKKHPHYQGDPPCRSFLPYFRILDGLWLTGGHTRLEGFVVRIFWDVKHRRASRTRASKYSNSLYNDYFNIIVIIFYVFLWRSKPARDVTINLIFTLCFYNAIFSSRSHTQLILQGFLPQVYFFLPIISIILTTYHSSKSSKII